MLMTLINLTRRRYMRNVLRFFKIYHLYFEGENSELTSCRSIKYISHIIRIND